MKKPNFFIIGAPKCGTTALSEYLRTHPNVFMCTPKEPHYFSPDFPTRGRTKWKIETLKRYVNLFQEATEDHLAIGEASVFYLYSSIAPKSLYEFNPKAKIVIMIRNPVDLVYSYHSQMVYSSRETEKNFKKAWALQEEREQGIKIPVKCPNPEFLNYSSIGKLFKHIEKWLFFFPRNQVKIILFDEFKNNTEFIYKDALYFLGVNSDEKQYFPIINSNKQYRNQILGNFLNDPPPILLKLAGLSKKILSKDKLRIIKLLRKINQETVERKPLDPHFRNYLIEHFEQDINHLSKLLGKDLNSWYN